VSRFTNPLVVVPLPDGRSWVVVCGDFEYRPDDGSVPIKVPQWMTTDFASIPQPFWSLVGGPWGRHGNAAVIHDCGYWQQERTRSEYDRLFLEGMRHLRVGRVRSRLMYLAVRVFGWRAWRDNREKNQQLGPDWRLYTDLRIQDLPVLAVTTRLRQLAKSPDDSALTRKPADP
jgi:hypothetical protein